MLFAVVPEDPAVMNADPAWSHVVNALNVQVTQQAGPDWGVKATVASYASAALVPTGPDVVPVVVMRNPPSGVEGCHQWQSHKASAVVRWSAGGAWSVAASHEIVETLVDPSLESFKPGPDPAGSAETVKALVEVCDPCAGVTYPVTPDSDIQVSDYCLPAYYAQNGSAAFTRCGQALHLWTPGSMVSALGYLTYCRADGWYQLSSGSIKGPYPEDELLANAMRLGMRGAVDRFTKFAKPPHLRPRKRRAPPKKKLPGKSRFERNKALANWIARLPGR